MNWYFEQLVVSFFVALCYGIIFNVPRSRLPQCGLAGMTSWIVYVVLVNYDVSVIIAAGVASFVIAIMSQLFSRKFRTPTIIFYVSGIFPLVPGGMAYNAVMYFVAEDYTLAIDAALNTFMISGAIAIGLILSEVVNQIIRSSRLRPFG